MRRIVCLLALIATGIVAAPQDPTQDAPQDRAAILKNQELLYDSNSPVGYTSVPFALGGKGFIFHSTLELAF
jgi:hypothetical protein